MPKVSVIMSTYNDAHSIKRSVESVLAQSFGDFEFIIINDCSSDDTSRIIHSICDDRIVYIENKKNQGLVHNLNKAIELSHGEYIARIDSDDVWITSDKLGEQVLFLDTHTDYALVGTYAKVYDRVNNFLFDIKNPETDVMIRKHLLTKNCFVHSSVLFRKYMAHDCTYYDETEKYVEDYGLWLRMGEKYKFANIDSYHVRYLLNEKGETQQNNLKQIRAHVLLLKKHKNKYPHYMRGLVRVVCKYIIVYVGGLKSINYIKRYIKG